MHEWRRGNAVFSVRGVFTQSRETRWISEGPRLLQTCSVSPLVSICTVKKDNTVTGLSDFFQINQEIVSAAISSSDGKISDQCRRTDYAASRLGNIWGHESENISTVKPEKCFNDHVLHIDVKTPCGGFTHLVTLLNNVPVLVSPAHMDQDRHAHAGLWRDAHSCR